MAQEIFDIFTHMHIVGIIALVLAMVCLILEIILSGFGICGLLSCGFFVIACVTRLIQGTTTLQTVVLIIVMVIVIVSVAMFTAKAKKEGKFLNALVNGSVAIPPEYSDPEALYGHLIGKQGTLLTQCKPIGKASIEGQTYEVFAADNGYITKGAQVEVVSVDGESIFVERI